MTNLAFNPVDTLIELAIKITLGVSKNISLIGTF